LRCDLDSSGEIDLKELKEALGLIEENEW